MGQKWVKLFLLLLLLLVVVVVLLLMIYFSLAYNKEYIKYKVLND